MVVIKGTIFEAFRGGGSPKKASISPMFTKIYPKREVPPNLISLFLFQGEFLQDVLTHLEHRTSHTQKKLEKGKKSIFTYLIIS